MTAKQSGIGRSLLENSRNFLDEDFVVFRLFVHRKYQESFVII